MTPEYLFPHHIVFGYIALWTVAEIVAARIWPIRVSCKKVSLLHCIVAFLVSSVWLARRFWSDEDAGVANPTASASAQEHNLATVGLYNFEVPGTFEHHVVSLSMAYFIVDMAFAIAFHRAFIVHHIICIIAFAAIQGYWKYLPENTPFFMDFMAWDTTPSPPKSHTVRHHLFWFRRDDIMMSAKQEQESDLPELQLLWGGLNGIFNLWMAELGGIFFHINRAFHDTDMELPSRGLFLMMFTFTRCFIWPTYLYHLLLSAAANDTHFHKVSAVLETGLFLTNLHFLYKNVAPIWKTGRLIPHKPEGFHRKWFDKHPFCKKIAGIFFRKEKISIISPNLSDSSLLDAIPAIGDGCDPAKNGVDNSGLAKKRN